jgi:flagellar motor switch/type III secretory pathway protein FliN
MSDDAIAQGQDQTTDPDLPEAETEAAQVAVEALQADDAGISVDALRLTIDFDIGRKSVPLAALSQWQNGTIVDLEPPALADGVAVTIRCNGDVVGTGDLVRIDDRIAVRVTRFLLAS